MISNRNSNFENIHYTEPDHKGCPIGHKGHLGQPGGTSDTITSTAMAKAYLSRIEEDYVNVIKRLRHIAGAEDTDKRDFDKLIDAEIRHHLYNLFNGISYAYEELEK